MREGWALGAAGVAGFALGSLVACGGRSPEGGAPDASEDTPSENALLPIDSPGESTAADGSDAASETTVAAFDEASDGSDDGGPRLDGSEAQVTCNQSPRIPDGGICNGDCLAEDVVNVSEPTGVGIYNGIAYLSDQFGNISECALPGCGQPNQLVVGPAASRAYAVSAGPSGVYWTDDLRTIWSAGLSGGGAHAIDEVAADAGDVSPDETALAGANLYWSLIPDGIMTCNVADCAATQRFAVPPGGSASLVNGLATDGVSLFWTSMDNGWLIESDFDGGHMQTLAPNLTAPGALAVDACNLYWVGWTPLTASTLTVMTCQRAACAQTVQLFATMSPRTEFASLALDDTNVYLLARDFQTLYVLPKP
jgi:hypothetical protein